MKIYECDTPYYNYYCLNPLIGITREHNEIMSKHKAIDFYYERQTDPKTLIMFETFDISIKEKTVHIERESTDDINELILFSVSMTEMYDKIRDNYLKYFIFPISEDPKAIMLKGFNYYSIFPSLLNSKKIKLLKDTSLMDYKNTYEKYTVIEKKLIFENKTEFTLKNSVNEQWWEIFFENKEKAMNKLSKLLDTSVAYFYTIEERE